jgi:putative ABC transport system permease protein
VSFLELVLRNVLNRKVRSALTGVAVAIAIMTVFALGVLTYSLRETAVSILNTGKADFTVGQKGVSDVIYSTMDESEVDRLGAYQGVDSAIGVLIAISSVDQQHPFFLELGIQPEHLSEFGVQLVAGRPFTANATNEMMLGYRAAQDFHKSVGDTFTVDSTSYTVVGIYSTGQAFGDSASMLPLLQLQSYERKPGIISLAFVRAKPDAAIDPLRTQIEQDHPELATVRTESEFGRIDRNLTLISAANVGASILALIIGAIGVMNTTTMSVFERTREFGILRAVGWSRLRLLTMVLSEALVIALAGAAVGLAIGYVAVQALKQTPELVGVFQPAYPGSVFARSLGIAIGMAFIGGLYPALRATLLRPIEALRHE